MPVPSKIQMAFASQTNMTLTTNGALTHSTSGSALVDLFSRIGSSRDTDIIPQWEAAYAEDPDIALRILLWARDIRHGGAGERFTYKYILNHLAKQNNPIVLKLIDATVRLGRWDDLFCLEGTPFWVTAALLMKNAITVSKDGLCAKWMPREGGSKSALARSLMGIWQVRPRVYRKMLSSATKVVEQQMCAREWAGINYEHVPSVAAARYKKAFSRNDADRYVQYIKDVQSGTKKMHAGAVTPYDILRALRYGKVDPDAVQAQWNSLPNYLEGVERRILPMCDVSGSMTFSVSGQITAMDVACSLTLYLAERNEGPLKNVFLTFTDVPRLFHLKGTLEQRYTAMIQGAGYSTNIELAFRALLNTAKQNRFTEQDMPTDILIFSDMQFDTHCIVGNTSTSFDLMRKMYSASGYKLPNLVFWNLNGEHKQAVAPATVPGAMLVSGFSPGLMKSVFTGAPLEEEVRLTPYQLMMQVVMRDHYAL